jgi:hypothetical protein
MLELVLNGVFQTVQNGRRSQVVIGGIRRP